MKGTASSRRVARWLLPTLAMSFGPLEAQVAPGSAAGLGVGNNYTAKARGISAMGFNPAGLGMPDSPRFSIALFPVSGRQSLVPIGLSDLGDVEGRLISSATKEIWLEQIRKNGGQTGGFGMDLTEIVLSYGPVGFQLSTLVRGGADLTVDGAEVLLYGNAGRTGAAQDFSFGGSGFHALAVSTASMSFGHALRVEGRKGADATLAVGATINYSVGHFLALAQDMGSQIRSDPLGVDILFPMIQSDTSDARLDHGSGLGLDLGGNWSQGPWSVGLALQNLFHSFEWNLARMSYRPGEVVFSGQDGDDADFNPRHALEAPEGLKRASEEMKFHPQLSLGASYQAAPELTIMGDVRKRMGDGIQVGPEFHAGLGMEYRFQPFLPVRFGLAKISHGFQFGGGIGLGLGRFSLNWAGALLRGSLDGSMASFSLSFGEG